ncbi:redoxin family protein [Armatimonas sp.]|uniref:redoxin family protein n=1 Tax=Armatimonas sp. TaxID=1872638 RepID=UPI003750AE24
MLPLALTVPSVLVAAALALPHKAEAPLVGTRLPDFRTTTLEGKEFHFYGLAGKKAVVFYFLGADCPIAKLSLPKLATLAKKYEAKGVAFVGINPNGSETTAQTLAAAKAAGVNFPIIADRQQKFADFAKVTRTCEALIVDDKATLRYRGSVDDQYGLGSRKPNASKHYLTDALDAILASKPVTTASSAVPGCLLDRNLPEPAADAEPEAIAALTLPDVGKVSYAEHVAPILQEKCESCHRPGQVGPFPLQSYANAKRWSAMIGETVTNSRMPPWHADPRHGNFVNDRSLSAKEKATVLAWVKQGTPEGDPKKLPAPKTFASDWNIGKPDRVLKMDKPYTIQATGVLPYQWFRVPTGFTEDKWIQAAEVKPGARSAVHHVLVFLDDKRGGVPNGLDGFVAEYVPGESPMVFPAGIAKKIPKNTDLMFQVHYTPNGTEQKDLSELGLIFSKEPPKEIVDTIGILSLNLRIPPGAESYKSSRSFTVPVSSTIYSYSPHMHVRGKAFRMSAAYPDGKEETLLSVPKYDFNWQTRYMLKEPKKVPAGTKILIEAWYDNSTKNPHNPDPTKTVTWGIQTFEEMMIGFIDVVSEGNKTEQLRMQNLLGGFGGRRRNQQ